MYIQFFIVVSLLAGTRCRPCPRGWMWSEENCYYLSAEAQAWEASQAFCTAHQATLPLLSHTQVRRRRWAVGGCGYRHRPQTPGKDLVHLCITEKITKAWGDNVTCERTRPQGSKVFKLLFPPRSRGGAGKMGTGTVLSILWPSS